MINIQYLHQIKKGSTVTYGNRCYRVQDDGKGYLHIIFFKEGERKKIGIDNLPFFEPATLQDFIFNGWFELYDSYEEYRSFALAELSWV